MPLDPAIAALLKLLESAGQPELSDSTPEQARQGFRQLTVGLRDPATLAPVASVRDVEVPGAAGPLRARVFVPLDAPTVAPTVLFLHGGGFVLGDIDTHEDHARLVASEARSVVVSLDYRLAPEAPFPAAYEDSLVALRWVVTHIDELGGTLDRVAVGGDSAGGNLAASVAQGARDEGITLAAQLLVYPAADMRREGVDYPSRAENAEGYLLSARDMVWFGEQYLPSSTAETDVRASPMLGDLTGLAPAVVGTAEFDPLRDEGNAYAEALRAAGVEVRSHQFPGLVHGFFGLGLVSDAAGAAVRTLCADLGEILHR